MPSLVNRLAAESSPYLQQHADNPVAWQPWDEEALERARREDRPILLSIGYSACHWCHVMAHESFEDEATAAVMNDHFVNIKVDREERPDLDRIYQTAHQLLNRRPGGWPLTLFLTPGEHLPIYAGTYFPPQPRHGLPAFRELLRGVAEAYRQQPEAVAEQGAQLSAYLNALADTGVPGEPRREPIARAERALMEQYDPRHGGFGAAPKFPHPDALGRLLHAADGADREAALHTLRRMALGGVYDQLAGGFFRYSVDERWMIPHFEKMLYDNGLLLALYAEAWAMTGDPLFRRVAEETGRWAMEEMCSEEGGFFSTLDADSDGEEGGYYVWERRELEALLAPVELAVVAEWYGLKGAPNFEGRWHLHAEEGLAMVAERLGISLQEVEVHAAHARERMLARRRRNPLPGRDEKILTAWNGLMIRGLAVAGRLLGEARFIKAARQAVEFIRIKLYHDQRLHAVYADGRVRYRAYLDDYAFLLDALLELLRASWRDEDLAFAMELANSVLVHYEDRERGGFYFTADDHERLIQRPKPLADEATPAGNGVLARALGRLGRLVDESRYGDAAERTLRAAWPAIEAMPHAHCSLLAALEERLDPPPRVIVRAPHHELGAWQVSQALLFFIPEVATLPGALAVHEPRPGGVAYLCDEAGCHLPIESPAALREALAEGGAKGLRG
ncbi:thioredoxin domain-containing protein [Endothiovibrio diazotrophicus]